MPPTTLAEDGTKFDQVITAFGKKTPMRGGGGLVFAGQYWPPAQDPVTHRPKNGRLYADVRTAFKEARRIVEAYLVATVALKGTNADATNKMQRWFGDDDTNGARRWWTGARAIIGALESFIVRDIHVYYHGDRSLIGQPNDYPGGTGNLVLHDIEGYAESDTGVRNNIVGLCEDFFAKAHDGAASVRLRGENSVAGVLLHELSHNICGTLDHCYSKDDAIDLANDHPSRAWYNADSIEYFCEDVMYGIP